MKFWTFIIIILVVYGLNFIEIISESTSNFIIIGLVVYVFAGYIDEMKSDISEIKEKLGME